MTETNARCRGLSFKQLLPTVEDVLKTSKVISFPDLINVVHYNLGGTYPLCNVKRRIYDVLNFFEHFGYVTISKERPDVFQVRIIRYIKDDPKFVEVPVFYTNHNYYNSDGVLMKTCVTNQQGDILCQNNYYE